MPSSEALTDDYLAQLLAKDAKDKTIKYSSYGLQALLPRRPTTNAPKPNTRFLKNIIKETDSHNAALRAKETADARARLRGVNGNNVRGDRHDRGRNDPKEPEVHASKRRKMNREEGDDRPTRYHHQSPSRSHKFGDAERREPRRRRSYEDYSSASEPVRSRHHRHHRRRRDRNASPDSDQGRRRERQSRHRARSRSCFSQRKSRSHHARRRSPSPSASSSPPPTRRSTLSSKQPSPQSLTHSSASDSDPLSSLIGPLPPSCTTTTTASTLPRGRGARHAHTSIDTHFSTHYDPNTDIHPPSSPEVADDWDNALEALRDRAKWKQAGGERLRAAGFTDEEVKKWEKSGSRGEDGDVEDVKWRGRGEGREWDRGKVVGMDGAVGVEAVEWGRLKGS